MFDNLYFIGTQIHSSWALTTTDGIVVIDTLFDYAIGPPDRSDGTIRVVFRIEPAE